MELESGSDHSELSLSEAPAQTEAEEQAVDMEEVEAGQELWDGDADEKPPNYDSLNAEDLPPLSYEAVLAAKALETTQQYSFIEEAPPTYIQLFGQESGGGEDSEDGRGGPRRSGRPGRRPHTRVRRSRIARRSDSRPQQSSLQRLLSKLPKLNKVVPGAVIIVSMVIGLSISMIVVGFLNIDVCRSIVVPLYLIVAGFVLLAEVTLHTVLAIGQKCSENKSTYQKLRKCDCLAFVLFIWLLIGSNWIFRLGTNDCSSDDVVEGGSAMVPVEPESGSATGVVVVVSEGLPPAESSEDCSDCAQGVYVFTAVIILMQYAAALCLAVICCSTVARRNRS